MWKNHQCLGQSEIKKIFHQLSSCQIWKVIINRHGTSWDKNKINLNLNNTAFCIICYKKEMTVSVTLFNNWTGIRLNQFQTSRIS